MTPDQEVILRSIGEHVRGELRDLRGELMEADRTVLQAVGEHVRNGVARPLQEQLQDLGRRLASLETRLEDLEDRLPGWKPGRRR